MAVSCGVLSQWPDVWSIAGCCSSIRTVEERIPAAQHEEAVDSGKTVGDTDGADIGLRFTFAQVRDNLSKYRFRSKRASTSTSDAGRVQS